MDDDAPPPALLLQFLQFGAPPPCLSSSSFLPFLPSLARLSSASPSLTLPLLSPLFSHPLSPLALSYTSLDFPAISTDVLLAEHVLNPPVHPSRVDDADLFAFLSGSSAQMDESLRFEQADEKERVKIAILSLRSRARNFNECNKAGLKLEKIWFQLQRDAGNIWNNAAYLTELTCLLPMAVSLCPAVLLPEHIVWGLLPTNVGFILLSSVLMNNPLLVDNAFSLLSEFLHSHHDTYLEFERNMEMDMESGSSSICSVTHGENMIDNLRQMQSEQLDNMLVHHCVKQALLTIIYLSNMSKSLAYKCREVLTKHHIFAGVIVYLTVEHLHDALDFMSKVMFEDKQSSDWMVSYIQSGQKDSYLINLMTVLESEESFNGFALLKRMTQSSSSINGIYKGGALHIREALLADAKAAKEKYGWCSQLNGQLRLFCVLIRAAEAHPTHEEINFWLNSFEAMLCEETLLLAISLFCLVPGLSSLGRTLYQKSVATVLNYKVNIEGKSTLEVEELTLWLSVQLFFRQFSEIAMVVREVLGMHLTIQNVLIQELHDAALAVGVISESSSLLKAVAALRPQGQISATLKCSYLLKCLEQLLMSGSFTREGIDISLVLSHCISISRSPIHPLLVQVIEAYVDAPPVLQCKSDSCMFKMPILPQSFLEATFAGGILSDGNRLDGKAVDHCPGIVRGVLVSYYMLYREKSLQNVAMESFIESYHCTLFNQERHQGNWWMDLLMRIPFKHFTNYMENNWLGFECIFPKWLSLAAGQFPEWFHVRDLLHDVFDSKCFAETIPAIFEEFITSANEYGGNSAAGEAEGLKHLSINKRSENTDIMTATAIRKAIDNALKDPLPVLQVLNFLCMKSTDSGDGKFSEQQLLIVKELVPKLLDRHCVRYLQDKFCLWFKSLLTVSKQTMIAAFVTAIIDTSKRDSNNENMMMMTQVKDLVLNMTRSANYPDLIQHPVILLACKLQVYRTPLLPLVLDILYELLIVNRRVCIGVASAGGRGSDLKHDEVSSALVAQDSAVCQILLEACLPSNVLGDERHPGSLFEARKIICDFLSGLLEENCLLLKLIHIQGYDLQLIPMMVDAIPAMVKCLTFVTELLQQEQPSKQVFSVVLIIKISCAYVELPESYTAVEKVIDHVKHVQKNVFGSSRFMQGILGALAQLACTFSEVLQDVIDILQICRKSSEPIKRNGPVRDPVLYRASLSAFKQIINQKVLYGRLSTSKMPEHDTQHTKV